MLMVLDPHCIVLWLKRLLRQATPFCVGFSFLAIRPRRRWIGQMSHSQFHAHSNRPIYLGFGLVCRVRSAFPRESSMELFCPSFCRCLCFLPAFPGSTWHDSKDRVFPLPWSQLYHFHILHMGRNSGFSHTQAMLLLVPDPQSHWQSKECDWNSPHSPDPNTVRSYFACSRTVLDFISQLHLFTMSPPRPKFNWFGHVEVLLIQVHFCQSCWFSRTDLPSTFDNYIHRRSC